MGEKRIASADHKEEVDNRESPSAQVLHDTIYKEAEKELSRSTSVLVRPGCWFVNGIFYDNRRLAFGILA